MSLVDSSNFFVRSADFKKKQPFILKGILTIKYMLNVILNLPNIPKKDGTIRTTAAEELFMKGMPRQARGFLFVTAESLQLLIQAPDVEEFDQMVSRCGDEPLAVFVPFGIHDGALVRVKSGERLS